MNAKELIEKAIALDDIKASELIISELDKKHVLPDDISRVVLEYENQKKEPIPIACFRTDPDILTLWNKQNNNRKK